MVTLASAARFYARNGLAVFPLVPGDKRPLIPSAHPGDDPLRNVCRGECGKLGHGLHDAVNDVDTVDRWWRHAPTANIGLRTGLLFDVIDVDIDRRRPAAPDGYASLEVLREAGVLPPRHGLVKTPRGGAHLYIAPTGEGNGASLAPGIDYRGAGGYVVAPPSASAEHGAIWEWTIPLDLEALR